MSRRITRRTAPSGILSQGNLDSAIDIQSPIYEGLVVDVILDFTHPEFITGAKIPESDIYSQPASDLQKKRFSKLGYNVGTIKVRLIDQRDTLDDRLLEWAHPLDSTISEYPLIGELVVLYKIRGDFLYTKKVPLVRQLQENAILNLNSTLRTRYTNTISNAVKSQTELELDSHKFGNYFRPDNRVRQLKHFEGDTLIQGRMGTSIRFGSSKMDPSSKGLAPNLILRTGQSKDIETKIPDKSPFGIILEDINNDASSLWMVSDQAVPFEPSTINAGSFYRSLSLPVTVFDKASIFLNSDRLVLNSKKNHILLMSNDEIYLNSFNRTSIDTDNSIILTANIDLIIRTGRAVEYIVDGDYNILSGGEYRSVIKNSTSFLSTKIYIGSASDDTEPVVGGTSLSIFLGRLIIALMGNPTSIGRQSQQSPRPRTGPLVPGLATTVHVITPSGPGRLSPAIEQALRTLYSELQQGTFKKSPFNSQDNFVNLVNEKVTFEPNDFKSGEQITTENNEWILGEPYYDIIIE